MTQTWPLICGLGLSQVPVQQSTAPVLSTGLDVIRARLTCPRRASLGVVANDALVDQPLHVDRDLGSPGRRLEHLAGTVVVVGVDLGFVVRSGLPTRDSTQHAQHVKHGRHEIGEE